MVNKDMTEQESLRVITDMINRARRENIGRFNFLTVYGALAFVLSLVARFVELGPWMWAWMAVPVVSLAVPFVLYRMWTWRGMFFSRILRNGFLLFAFMGLVAAYYSLKGNMNLTIVMMVAPPACAMLLLCGLLRSSGLLVIGGWGIVIIVNAVFSDRPFFFGIGQNSSLYYNFFYLFCVLEGLSIDRERKTE